MPELSISEVSKFYDDAAAVKDVDITIKDGEFFTLLGPSGCGKSTTLSCVAGLTEPDKGTIRVGKSVFVDQASRVFLPPEQRNLGMVFQSYALWPHMTVAQNLAVPLKLRRIKGADRKQRINDTLQQVGLEELGERYPHQLSGGQQQRVALARALVYSPSVLLLDEPLSNLDAKLRDRARTWLKRLQDEIGITTLYVTHDQLEALSLSDRIAVMGNNQVLQIGTPRQIYEEPASPEVAAFIGRCNFLPGTIHEHDRSTSMVSIHLDGAPEPVQVHAASPPPAGTPVTVAVRAERLSLHEPGTEPSRTAANTLPMTLESQAYVGARFEYQLSFGDQLVLAEGTTRMPGEHVHVVLPADGCVLFTDFVAPGIDADT